MNKLAATTSERLMLEPSSASSLAALLGGDVDAAGKSVRVVADLVVHVSNA